MKLCGKCDEEKPNEAFGKRRNGLQPFCRECNRAYQKKHYQENRETYHAKRVKYDLQRRMEIVGLLLEYFSSHPCVDCGEKDAVVLQFDHVRDTKTLNVSDMIHGRFRWSKILKEIEKCDVRCANCHCRRTAQQFGCR